MLRNPTIRLEEGGENKVAFVVKLIFKFKHEIFKWLFLCIVRLGGTNALQVILPLTGNILSDTVVMGKRNACVDYNCLKAIEMNGKI